ncbi:CopG family ribbon-helix-helix protein [Candidatus Hodarchaeum mangrovi]
MASKGNRETITFSCEPELKSLISNKVTDLGYQNQSQMIRDALQAFFKSERALEHIPNDSRVVTLVSVVYNHDDSIVVKEFISAQHESHITFSNHFHLEGKECLENLMVDDTAQNIKQFIKKLRSIAGLKNISISVISRTEDSSSS